MPGCFFFFKLYFCFYLSSDQSKGSRSAPPSLSALPVVLILHPLDPEPATGPKGEPPSLLPTRQQLSGAGAGQEEVLRRHCSSQGCPQGHSLLPVGSSGPAWSRELQNQGLCCFLPRARASHCAGQLLPTPGRRVGCVKASLHLSRPKLTFPLLRCSSEPSHSPKKLPQAPHRSPGAARPPGEGSSQPVSPAASCPSPSHPPSPRCSSGASSKAPGSF